jgi:Flp pilus assembly pilin Flp
MNQSLLVRSGLSAPRLLARWLRDDRGQDLIEYVLLGAVVALVGLAGFQAIAGVMGPTYQSWDTSVQTIWETPDPVGP